jgi:bacillithiol system protein YtxJ
MGLFNFSKSEKKLQESKSFWVNLTSIDTLQIIVEGSVTKPKLIFKDSYRCGVSKMARRQFENQYPFSENEVDSYLLDLITYREVSNKIEEITGVYHQSPQLIVLFNKKVIYESIKSQFYTNSATASALFEVGLRKSYASTDERVLENQMAIFSIPQRYYGEGIKVGTVTLEDETLSRTYTDDGYSNLIDSGSNIKGNIFYDRGLVVVTKDIVSGSVLNQFTLRYRSTKTIYENEIFLSVLENEFNVSQNPSAVDFNGVDFGKIKLHNIKSNLINDKFGGFADYEFSSSIDPTGAYLAPYITTIALYDDDLNMVAVAKLPHLQILILSTVFYLICPACLR